jgi:DNA-binding MarR family transcriptional regulator
LEKAGQVKLGYDARRWVYRITAAGKAILAQHEAQIVAQDASATGVPASVRRMLE